MKQITKVKKVTKLTKVTKVTKVMKPRMKLAEHNHELKAGDYSWCREPDMTIKPEKRLLFIMELYYVRCCCG